MSAPQVRQSGAGLADKTMGPLEVLAQSIAAIAPSAVMATGPALIVLSAGNGSWLSYVIAMVLVILIGLCVAQFGTKTASAGSLYGYVGQSLGAGGAFAAGWALVIGYTFIAMIGVVGVGIYGGALLDGIGVSTTSSVAQVVILIVAGLAAAAFSWIGIKISTRVGLVLEIVSIAAILILLVTTIVERGAAPDPAQLSLNGSSFDGITFGVVLAVLGFVGFESAAALGAEAKDPHRAIPRAVLTSAVVVGVLYVFAAYTSVLGLGTDGLGNSAAPMDDLSRTVGLSGFRYVIDLGVTASFFAVTIASINAASRVLFAVAHDGVLHTALRRAHTRHRTPHVAILALLPPVVLVPAIMILLGVTPLEVYAYTGTIGTFGYLTAYLLMAVGMPIYLRRHHTVRTHHWVLSAAAVVAILYVIYKNLVPVPAYPYNILPYLYLALLVIGIVWYAVARGRGAGGAGLVEPLSDPAAQELTPD
ncbi:APC family permease [Pseudonocardia sp. 73-21]|mgnify:FL=1|uniref:APC family permease n=1 Tax=Pseudonocardia sp. 73-21 TaxID=1895809 RepID=UPI000964F157|nr:APC family permease [Pseudonocardia sp. 73-21]OJY46383.1 MAG: amino acid permease [Pseudonocardia sp. 73-21]